MKEKILDAGIKLWHGSPDYVTARGIARVLNVTHPAITYHFPQGVKDAVAEHAVKISDYRIMLNLITTDHNAVKHLSKEDKHRIIYAYYLF